ncbi:MAG: M1 family metallopeptidase [Gemmatimonadota bacterium]|nr:M1 family metallopeptidase [Gemmatimonadota bacterium]
MFSLRSVAIATVLFGSVTAGAQQGQMTVPPQTPGTRTGAADTSIFADINLYPSPNVYRSADGRPGPRYWQQRADYDLHATLDTAANSLSGSMTMRYTNNSPDTLRFIWIQTEQNAFRPNSLNTLVFAPDSRFGSRSFVGGDVIDHFEQVLGGRRTALKLRDNGTVTKVDLAEPLAPGRTATFDAAWHFLIPEHGADRMGRDGALYELAQWYPRVNVYDDVRGWNTEPYLGQGEFYLEYGDFNLSITVPAGYTVASTGTLENSREVLTAAEISRLAKAATSTTPVAIVTQQDLTSGAARPRTSGTMTWRFKAHNVRDMAWAASPEYLWDASSWKGILAQAYYRPSAATIWNDAADQSRMSIQEYSERWFMYPYPQISAVEGPISGMEYPMLAMEARSRDKLDLYNVVTHEIGHNWFPMIVGSNERMHFWQDEGMNTFVNTFSEARRYPQNGDQMQRAAQERAEIEGTQRLNVDVPIEQGPDRIDPRKLGFTEYTKVSVGMQLLRQEILGPEAFDDAFREYIRRWAFKHPTPTDFYRTMESVGGERLDWFWREWFFDNAHFDQAIESVQASDSSGVEHVVVVYGNRARGVLPIYARFTFNDGTTQDFKYPALVWSTNSARYIREYNFTGKTVKRIDIDPDHVSVDVDRTNNSWMAKP